MNLLVALTVSIAVGGGVYLVLSRELMRCITGLVVLGAAINLAVFSAGGLGPLTPPLIETGADRLVGAPDPLPQALVLTAIVISFAMLCLCFTLAARLRRETGREDLEELSAAEPPSPDPQKPPELDW